ncbi:MAG TPA: helix-turn-helix domain-containing protein, partial [Candidatus Saccharimonadales bacterium]|nr:helix-turn-helix domain-containing protein [Candidatus Saccharimonadales bacterium]
ALLRAARSGSAGATERGGRAPRLLISTGRDPRETPDPLAEAHRDLLSMSAVIEIPPLRERKEDILLLAAHFLARRCRTAGRAAAGLSPEAQACLLAYPWPGNVREMEEVVSEARLSPGEPVLRAEHLPARLRELPGPGVSALPSIPEEGILWQKQVESFERGLLQQALDMSRGKKVEAAQRLGLNKDQMKYLCRKYGY